MRYLEKAKKVVSNAETKENPGAPASETTSAKVVTRQHNILAYSEVLGREIMISWTGDDSKVVYIDRTPYMTEEIAKLKGVDATEIRAAHLLKETFQGKILDRD